MGSSRTHGRRRVARRLMTSAVLAVAALAGTAMSASAATTATFSNGTLSVFGDSLDNSVTISRNPAVIGDDILPCHFVEGASLEAKSLAGHLSPPDIHLHS